MSPFPRPNGIRRLRVSPLISLSLAMMFWAQWAVGAPPKSEEKKDANLYGEIKPAEFAEREDVQRTIDPRNFDAKLLSAEIFHQTRRPPTPRKSIPQRWPRASIFRMARLKKGRTSHPTNGFKTKV